MDDVLTIVLVLGLCLPVIRLVWLRYSASQAYPRIDYAQNSTKREETWRWRHPAPDLGLEVIDTAECSTVVMEYRGGFVTNVSVALGYAGIAGTAALAARLTTAPHPWLGLVLVFFCAALSFAALNVGATAERLELRPDTAAVVVRYGWWWQRRHVFRPLHFHVSGRYQSSLSMNRYQKRPMFVIRIRGRLLGSSFLTPLNQTQGSWLVGGLADWADLPR